MSHAFDPEVCKGSRVRLFYSQSAYQTSGKSVRGFDSLLKLFEYSQENLRSIVNIHFLGTSAGTPTPERNVTAVGFMAQGWKNWWLFDCGEGTQQRLLRSSLSLPRLNKIFITHLHGDHCYGLFGLLTSRGLMSGGSEGVHIIGPKGIKEMVETVFRLSYVHLAAPLKITEFKEAGVVLKEKGMTVSCVRLSHDVPSWGYVLQEDDHVGSFLLDKAKADGIPSGPLFGDLKQGKTIELEDGRKFEGKDYIGESQKGRRVIISGDNDKPGRYGDYLKDADVFIHESTHTEETIKSLSFKSRHSTAQSVAQCAAEAQVKNLILTHFSPRFYSRPREGALSIQDIEDEAKKFYDGNLHLAMDYDEVNVDRQGKLSVINSRRRR